VLDSVTCDEPFAFANRGIYFLARGGGEDQTEIWLLDLSTGGSRRILTIEHWYVACIVVSSDDTTVLYTQLDLGSDPMLVENFR